MTTREEIITYNLSDEVKKELAEHNFIDKIHEQMVKWVEKCR